MTIHHNEGHCCADCGEPLGVPSYSEGMLPPCANPDCETNASPEAILEFQRGASDRQPDRYALCPHCLADIQLFAFGQEYAQRQTCDCEISAEDHRAIQRGEQP